ncbi:hypothetical protein J6590_039423 [Homalodisca vitripennis]|nr:hypothetical protein J6590_039423 [Homalodisca vitripennis]
MLDSRGLWLQRGTSLATSLSSRWPLQGYGQNRLLPQLHFLVVFHYNASGAAVIGTEYSLSLVCKILGVPILKFHIPANSDAESMGRGRGACTEMHEQTTKVTLPPPPVVRNGFGLHLDFGLKCPPPHRRDLWTGTEMEQSREPDEAKQISEVEAFSYDYHGIEAVIGSGSTCSMADPFYSLRTDFRTTANGQNGGLCARTGSLSGHPSKQQPRSTLLESVISRNRRTRYNTP